MLQIARSEDGEHSHTNYREARQIPASKLDPQLPSLQSYFLDQSFKFDPEGQSMQSMGLSQHNHTSTNIMQQSPLSKSQLRTQKQVRRDLGPAQTPTHKVHATSTEERPIGLHAAFCCFL